MNKRDYNPCETCIHEEVCQYKKDLYAAQEYVDEVVMSFSNNSDYTEAELRDLPFVHSINIICKYYSLSGRALSEKLSTTTTHLEVPQWD